MNPSDGLPDDDVARALRDAVALPDAPPALVHAAIGLWRTAPPAAEPLLRRLLAVLTFDSWAPQPGAALAVRGGRGGPRHLLFTAEGRDVDLRITPEADGWSLAGQVLGPDEAGRVEVAAERPAVSRVATLDAHGEFRIDAVPAGTYRMTLRLGHDEVALPDIEVGHRAG